MTAAAAPPRCLLVLPHYNQVGQLRRYLADLLATLPAQFRMIVSDDGSAPPAQEELRRVLAEAREAREGAARLLDPVISDTNRGKGSAVYAGWQAATDEELLAFADCDGATPAGEVLRGFEYLARQCKPADVLAGSRIRLAGRTVKRRRHRHYAGRVFAACVGLLTRLPVHDTQCGFKIVPREAFETIRQHLRCRRFAFDVELLLFLERAGCRLIEFPVDWHDVPGGTSSVMRHSLPMLVEVVAAARNAASFRRRP